MSAFSRTMSSLFCCFGFSHKHELRQTAMNASTKDSPMSMSVPSVTVPHAIDSPNALHNIFASNSSMRGYNAVYNGPLKHHPNQGSLDFSFRFGSESPKRKPHSRLDHLTHHVKQKLSESKFDKGDDHGVMLTTAPIQFAKAHDDLLSGPVEHALGHSQRSAGLTELLASRTGSEGGYDSDAKSIQTPVRWSGAGTLQIEPRVTRTSLAPIEVGRIASSPIRQEGIDALTEGLLPSAEVITPSPPPPPETCEIMAFRDIIKGGSTASPGDVRRRLSDGMADGSVESPNTPHLRPIHVTSIDGFDRELRLSHLAPRRASSLRSNNKASLGYEHFHVDNSIQKLADHVDQTSQENMKPAEAKDSITKMDSEQLCCFHGLTAHHHNKLTIAPSPTTAFKVVAHKSDANSTDQAVATVSCPVARDSKSLNILSSVASEAQSVHLFNMRISQKLASSSQVPLISTTTSNNTSFSSIAHIPPGTVTNKSASFTVARAPTFIAIERLRRPSDPETRKLFELPKAHQFEAKWLRSVSPGSITGLKDPKQNHLNTVDDSSSYYGSILDGAPGTQDLISHRVRGVSLKNTNSLAVGGRSASGPFNAGRTSLEVKRMAARNISDGTVPIKVSHTLDTDVQICREPVESRTASMPKVIKFIKVDTTPTPINRRFPDSTEVNESMSEIGMDRMLGNRRGTGESISTQAMEDHDNERFSDVDTSSVNNGSASRDGTVPTADAGRKHSDRTGWSFNLSNDTPTKCKPASSANVNNNGKQNLLFPGERDNTSEIWRKAFNRLGEPGDAGRLLATPQFDREGRRRPSVQSVSDQSQRVEDTVGQSESHRRSQSVDVVTREPCRSIEMQKRRRRSVPTLSSYMKKPSNNKSLTWNRRIQAKKKSLVDLGRRVIAAGPSKQVNDSPSARETFGVWGRFGSHTREERNGPANDYDDVRVHDFQREPPFERTATPASQSSSLPGYQPRHSWKLRTLVKPTLNRQNTKSMSFVMSPAERAKQKRKGLVGRFKKLYRAKSSELHSYALNQGHRGSVCPGLSAEYPELECLPDGGIFGRNLVRQPAIGSDLDGMHDHQASLDTISEVVSRRSGNTHCHTLPWAKKDAQEWSRIYQECVGSMSALRSDETVGQNLSGVSTANERRVLSLSSALRDSTVNFEAELRHEANKVREKLLQQLQSSSEDEKGLKMPGSFV